MKALLGLAFVTVAIACGCGEEGSDAVERTVEDIATALVEGDGETACAQMTPAAQEELLAAVLASDQSGPHFKDCEEAASTLGGGPAASDIEVGDVSIEEATATASVEESGARLKVSLERQAGGEWLVSDPKQLLFGAPEGQAE